MRPTTDASGRARYLVASPLVAPVRMRPRKSASTIESKCPSSVLNSITAYRIPERKTVYVLNPTTPSEGTAAASKCITPLSCTIRVLERFTAFPCAHAPKACSSTIMLPCISNSESTSPSRSNRAIFILLRFILPGVSLS